VIIVRTEGRAIEAPEEAACCVDKIIDDHGLGR